MAGTSNPPPRDVALERDGQTYRGSYVVTRGVVTVSSLYGSKATQVGNLDAAQVARLLLSELVTEYTSRT